MSKLTNALNALKVAVPYVKATVVIVANANDAVEYKHKAKVENVLQGLYKAADLVERIL